MMNTWRPATWKVLAMLALFGGLLLVIVACGGDDEEPTAAPAAPTAAPAPAPTQAAPQPTAAPAPATQAATQAAPAPAPRATQPPAPAATQPPAPAATATATRQRIHSCGDGHNGGAHSGPWYNHDGASAAAVAGGHVSSGRSGNNHVEAGRLAERPGSSLQLI